MSHQQLKRALKALQNEHQETQARLDQIREAIEALEALMPREEAAAAAVQKSTPKTQLSITHNGSKPRGIQAVKRVLQHSSPLTVREITTEVQRRGWIKADASAPMESTRVALRRLAAKDERIHKLPDGRWTYEGSARGS